MWFNYNEGQQLFTICIWGVWQIVNVCFKLLIYSPFIICGWALTNLILNKQDHILLWIAFVFLFGFIFFKGILFLRELIQSFRAKGNFGWMAVWIFCTGFTTVIPVWIVFNPIEKLIEKLSHGSHIPMLTWIMTLAYGYFIYSRYQFLERKG